MGRLNDGSITADGPKMTVADLHRFCVDANASAEKFDMDRWYYVTKNKDTGVSDVRALDGDQAIRVRRAGAGWKPDYHGWDAERLEGEGRLLRWFFKQGGPLE